MGELIISDPEQTKQELIDWLAEIATKAMVHDEIKPRAEAWAAARDRAVYGLEFSQRQQEQTAGFPDSEYWHGKVNAYTAILDLLLDLV